MSDKTGIQWTDATGAPSRVECGHGSLRRQCIVCDRDDEIAALKASMRRALDQLAQGARGDAGITLRMTLRAWEAA